MRAAGRIAAQVREVLEAAVRPGITTGELDRLAGETIRQRGATPAFLGYRGFPASICASVNDEVVHGIPGRRRLLEGDIISIDVGVFYEGYCGDTAFTCGVGEVSPEAGRLMRVTAGALERAIAAARPGAHLGDLGHAVQTHVEAQGFSVVRDYVGHGIGRAMHEDPQLPNYGIAGTGCVLEAGMTLAIEPMVNAGQWAVKVDANGWTVRAADGSLSAHYEHTVAVGAGGPEVLTVP
jgi:methionyl aminopeptidase